MPSLAELRQHLSFIAAGIDDLVPYGGGSDGDNDVPRCVECNEIAPCQFERNAE